MSFALLSSQIVLTMTLCFEGSNCQKSTPLQYSLHLFQTPLADYDTRGTGGRFGMGRLTKGHLNLTRWTQPKGPPVPSPLAMCSDASLPDYAAVEAMFKPEDLNFGRTVVPVVNRNKTPKKGKLSTIATPLQIMIVLDLLTHL